MENAKPNEQFPPCTVDIKRPDKTHIFAWKDKAEFQAVYDLIFQSPPDDIATKEDGVKWLNVWKLRQNRATPICIRCTLAILEAQLFDLRSQRDGRENTTETKNIYAGAFTRFINFITEEGQNIRWKKTSIAQQVRGIGIETYLVELRHLCAHRSISVSIDVFRRSAKYCMDWLNASYWQRELTSMQPVSILTMRNEVLSAKLPELTIILRTYDAATAGLAMNVNTVSQAASCLKPDELALLQKFASGKLYVIASTMLRNLQETLSLPRNSVGVNAICNGLIANCKHLFLDAIREATKRKPAPLGTIHSALFRYLAATGCLQAFFERLMAICENEAENADQRLAAKHWALKIAVGFQLLRQFKKACKSLPAAQVVRFHETSKKATSLSRMVVRDWFKQTLGADGGQHLMLGLTIDCPWHLNLPRAYLQNRLTAVNQYTEDIVPVLVSLVQPPLKLSQQKKLGQLMHIYLGEENHTSYESDEPFTETTPRRSNARKAKDDDESMHIHTAEDLLRAMAPKRPAGEPLEGGNDGKRSKRYGPWSEEADGSIDWQRCPLGTCHVSVKV